MKVGGISFRSEMWPEFVEVLSIKIGKRDHVQAEE